MGWVPIVSEVAQTLARAEAQPIIDAENHFKLVRKQLEKSHSLKASHFGMPDSCICVLRDHTSGSYP